MVPGTEALEQGSRQHFSAEHAPRTVERSASTKKALVMPNAWDYETACVVNPQAGNE